MHRGFILCLFLATIVCLGSALTFTADAGRDTCFYDELKNGDAVTFMYQVTQGGALDIDLTVRASTHDEIWNGSMCDRVCETRRHPYLRPS